MNLVMVHIGDNLPPYFWDTCEQVRRFSGCKIHVVIPGNCLNQNAIQRIGVTATGWEELAKDEIYQNFEKKCYLHDFWKVTMGRLYILEILIRRRQLKHVVHIENDVLIYHDPNNLINEFKKVGKNSVLLTPVGDDYASAAYLYVKNHHPIANMNRVMLETLVKGKALSQKLFGTPDPTEMMIIAHLWKRYDNLIAYFPVFTEGKGSVNLQAFNSIFDGASLGQYVGGTNADPPGWTGQHHWAGKRLALGKHRVEFRNISHGRRVPYLFGGNKEYRINNLHIHSKKVKEFM